MLRAMLWLWIACVAIVSASPASGHRHSRLHLRPRAEPIAGGVSLRILPLGDSITWGEKSTDGNGYRGGLYDKLSETNKVEFIGSVEHGAMKDNKSEGHRGYPIDAVGSKGKSRYHQRPNVILLMAGTNDFVFKISPTTAPQSLGKLIDAAIEACPDATILVATLPPLLLDEARTAQVAGYNQALPDLVERYGRQDKQVALVDMSEILPELIHADKIHPTDAAYSIMAQSWYDAIVEAGKKGWLHAPVSLEAAESTGSAPQSSTSPDAALPTDPASNETPASNGTEQSAQPQQGGESGERPVPEAPGPQDAQTQPEQGQEAQAQANGDQNQNVEQHETVPAGKKPPLPHWTYEEDAEDDDDATKSYTVEAPSLPDIKHHGGNQSFWLFVVFGGLALALVGRRVLFAGARRYRPLPQHG